MIVLGHLCALVALGRLVSSSNRICHCLIVRLMLCLILVEKSAAGKAAEQDTERQATKGQAEGMPEF